MSEPTPPVPHSRAAGPLHAEEPAEATTFTAALEHWNNNPRDNNPSTDRQTPPPGPRLLQQDLPLPPAGLPSPTELHEIAAAAADRAQLLLDGAPVPDTPVDHAVHITATRPGTPLEPTHRLGLDVGHWRELVTNHRDHHTLGRPSHGHHVQAT
ncbi:hypothetical protein AB0C52_23960 [Streptomyces sp. NPDC048717]|uniref:hypothetical protein n=1 Tax=Streptomyces sp. NPDC048717 TaxID=3154928 RepID=UPI00343950C6